MDAGLEAMSAVTVFKNVCPLCKNDRFYKKKVDLQRSNRRGLMCNSCANSIKAGGSGNVYNDKNQKKCHSCNEFKDQSEYYSKKNGGNGGLCRDCSLERSKNYNKSTYRFSRHGITEEDYLQLLDSQDGKCPICTLPLEVTNIDHCHKTGKVRGVLCSKCNRGLGQFEDDINILNNAIKYLKTYE